MVRDMSRKMQNQVELGRACSEDGAGDMEQVDE